MSAPECRCVDHPPFLGWSAYTERGGCPIHSPSFAVNARYDDAHDELNRVNQGWAGE